MAIDQEQLAVGQIIKGLKPKSTVQAIRVGDTGTVRDGLGRIVAETVVHHTHTDPGSGRVLTYDVRITKLYPP